MRSPTEREQRRSPPDGQPWVEQHRVEARCLTSGLAIAWQFGLYDLDGPPAVAFQCVVGRPGANPVVISDLDIAPPQTGWEFRSSGLWADHICEEPMRHWSYGLEAFAVAIDDPRELLGRGYGERLAVGWELDFESAADPAGSDDDYHQRGELHGLVLFTDGEIEVQGPAVRSHRWGPAANPRPESGPDVGLDGSGPAVALPTPAGIWWVDLDGEPGQDLDDPSKDVPR